MCINSFFLILIRFIFFKFIKPFFLFIILIFSALGGQVVNEPYEATHLVLTRLVRSSKLLCSLPVVHHILTSKWLIDSAQAGHFLPTETYEWCDEKFTETFGCDIQKTIKSSTRSKLFEGKTFYMTPSVHPRVKDLTKLIESSGGVVEKHRRSANRIAETNAQSPESYIILSCMKDLHLLADLVRQAKATRCICTTEAVLTSIMTQTIDLEMHIIKYF